jgi:hypothetical protein
MKKLKLLLIIACACSVWQTKAQTGASCSTPITLIAEQPPVLQNQTGNKLWFSFTANDNAMLLDIIPTDSTFFGIDSVIIYKNDCGGLATVQFSNKSATDTVPMIELWLRDLTIGSQYTIKISKNNTPQVNYTALVYKVQSVSCIKVANGGFDLLTTPCPVSTVGSALSGSSLLNSWVENGATADYFNTCAASTSNINPNNSVVNLLPSNGNGYVGLYTGYPPPTIGDHHEYVTGGFTSPLTAGKKYYISMQYAKRANSKYASDGLGIAINSAYVLNTTTAAAGVFQPAQSPIVSNPIGQFMTNTTWQLMGGCYQAIGNENYLTIGNFTSGASTSYSLTNPAGGYQPYYFIDDVRATLLDITTSTNNTICPSSVVTLTAGLVCALPSGTSATYSWTPSLGLSTTTGTTTNASPSVSTIYTVSATIPNTNGTSCSVTQTVLVTVVNSNTVTTLYTNTVGVICANANATLTANGSLTYTWSTGANTSSIIVTPSVTSTYTVSGTNSCGYINAATVTVNVVQPQGPISVSVTTNSLCFGGTTTLQASGALSYTWIPTTNFAVGSTANVSPSVTTTYTVFGGNNVCTNTQSATATVVILQPVVSVTPFNPCGLAQTFTASLNCNTYPQPTPSFVWYIYTGSGTGGTLIYTNQNNYNNIINYTFPNAGVFTLQCIYVDNFGNQISNIQTYTVTATPPPPTITTNTNTATVCVGGSVTFTASGASSYTWTPCSSNCNSNTITVTPTVTTIYTVTGTNACGLTGTKTVTVNVSPPLTLTASVSPNPICSGSSATLVASGTATSFTWTGVGQGNNISVTPTVTTTYTVIGSNSVCPTTTISAVVTLTVNSAGVPAFAITNSLSNFNIVANGTGTNVVNFGSTITYTSGLAFTWNTGSIHTPTANLSITQPTVVTLAITNVCGGSQTQTVCVNYVATTCANTTLTVLNNYTLTSNAQLPNGAYYVTGTLTLDWSAPGLLAFELKSFLMTANAKVRITANSVMNINNVNFYSCDGMWEGIELMTSPSAAPSVTITGDGNSIEDAYKGLYTINPSGTNRIPIIVIANGVKFNKNYYDVYLDKTNNVGSAYPFYLTKSRMLSEASTYSPGGNLKCSNYYSPTVKARSYAGLYATNAGIININTPVNIPDNNVIKNKDYGLYFNSTNANVYYTTISDAVGIQDNYLGSSPYTPRGVGIYSTNSGSLTVKQPGVATTINSFFTNLGYGIVTKNTSTVDVQYTAYNTTTLESYTVDPVYGVGGSGTGLNGVYATDATSLLRVNNNTFSQTYFPVSANYSTTPTSAGLIMSIAQNTIGAAAGGVVWVGVTVQSALAFNTASGNMRVAANTFTNVDIGVKTIAINNGLRISNNSILLNALTTGTKHYGVYLAGANNAVIVDNNSIDGGNTNPSASGYSTVGSGIMCENSPGCKIQCNTVTKIGNGIEYRGGNTSSGDGFFKNTLLYPIRRGLTLSNAGVVGTQGSSTKASANQWTGAWPAVATADPNKTEVGGPIPGTLSDASGSPLWVRNTSAELPDDNFFTSPSVVNDIYSASVNLFTLTPTVSDIATCNSALTQGLRIINPVYGTPDPDRDADFVRYINTVLPASSSSLTPQDKFTLKQYMFEALSQNFSTDATLINFYNQQQSTAINTYYDIDSLLAIGNISLATSKNASASVNNDITQTQNSYNNFYINGIQSQADMDELIYLANLCPNQYGNAVYQARALLQTITYANTDYNDNCNTDKLGARLGYNDDEKGVSVTGGVIAKLYPNPNNGEFNLAYDLKTNNEATLQITDVAGKLVYTSVIDNLNNIVQLNTKYLQAGIYFVQLIHNKQLLWTDKLIISK